MHSFQKFFFGNEEIIIPVFKNTPTAAKEFPKADTFLNFASFRTAFETSLEALDIASFKTIMITAEGIPERFTREINLYAKKKKKLIIGPATVGAITPGCFKTANIGGTIEGIVDSSLHIEGSAGLVTRSGGLFNEIANIISRHANGIAEGVAIGGDQFPGSSFLDHMLRMEKNPAVQYLVLLGEVGGTSEYEIIDAIKNGLIKKPVIAWCIGTVLKHLTTNVQFGHAGANASSNYERASSKNNALKRAGIIVPKSFNSLHESIHDLYTSLRKEGKIKESNRKQVPHIPEDFSTAKKSGHIRKETNFVCTISDEIGRAHV